MSLALKGLQDIKWNVVDLPDIVFFQEGPGVRKSQYTQDGVKLLNVANLQKGKIDLSTSERYISKEEAYGRYEHFLVDEGDLIIASSGIQISYFEEKMGFITGEHLPLCMNTSTIRFKSLNEDVLNIRYFMYFLKTNFFKKQIQRLITGSAQLNFGPSHLKQIKVILPKIEIQNRIVDLLDITQNMIDKRQQQIEALSALKQSIFLDMFGDPIRNNKNWNVGSVRDYCDCIVPGRNKPKNFTGDIPWITTEDLIDKGITNFSNKSLGLTVNEIDEVRAKIIPKGSVLLTCVGDLGRVSIAGNDCVINQQLHSYQPGENINNTYLMYFLSYQKPYMYKYATQTTVPYMNKTTCNNLPVFIPPLKLQEVFAQKIVTIDKRVDLLSKGLVQLNLLYDSILYKAFNGELFKED